MQEFQQRFNSGSLKFDDVTNRYGASDRPVFPMWVADTDFPPPEMVNHGLSHFLSSHFGYQQLAVTAAVSQWHWRRGEYIDESSIVDCCSIIAAMGIALESLTRPGDKVGIFIPSYGPFFAVTEKTQRKICPLTLDISDGNVHMDLSSLPDDLSAVLLCNPHNPTGRLWQRDELEALAEWCTHRNIPLICDEVHRGFIAEGNEFVSLASIGEAYQNNIIVLQSPSKSYNLAHVPAAAYAIIVNQQWRDAVRAAITRSHLFAGALARQALILAYDELNDLWLQTMEEKISENRALLTGLLHNSSLLACIPQSTFFLWLDLRDYLNHVAPGVAADYLFKCTGIAANDGADFRSPGFVRLNFATSGEVIKHVGELLLTISSNK